MSSGKGARYNRFSGGPSNLPTPDTAGVRDTPGEGRLWARLVPTPHAQGSGGLSGTPSPSLEVPRVGCAMCVVGVSASVRACGLLLSAHIHVCVHILRGVRAKSHSFSLQTRMETTFGPAFSAVTTITKGELGAQASLGRRGSPPSRCLPPGPPEPPRRACLPPLRVGTTSHPVPDQVTPTHPTPGS